jgi:acetyl esterase/lipase
MLRNFIFLIGILSSIFGWAQTTIPLWDQNVPGTLGNEEEDNPTLTIYLAENTPTNAAVLICPGGGYTALALDHEGRQIAEWFNQNGVHAFILKYRLGRWDGTGYKHPVMLGDAKRAFRLIRTNAGPWNIDPDKIGVMGFSAGGHLASTLGTHFDDGNPESPDVVEKASCLPNFMILGYPVISFKEPFAHRGSRRFLLGPTPTQAEINLLSNEMQVKPLTPPTFLFHTNEDRGVPPENSVYFYLALRKAGIPAEMHIYEKGKHGVGFAPEDPVLSTWKERLKDWLKHRDVIR